MSRDEMVQWRDKGFWHPDGTVDGATFVAERHSLFDGAFTWPVMVLKERALDHNLATLKAFAEAHGLLFAPHGKTTMAPALYDRQLAAGAWGITLATASQVAVARHAGIARILLANEILDETALRWLAAELERDPGFELWCYVDSPQGVDVVSRAVQAVGATRGVEVLVELGYPGGRTGCRDHDSALSVAQSAADAPGVRLAGVAGYEGGLASADAAVDYLRSVRALVVHLHALGLLPQDAIVSAGGSAYFDVVAQAWGGNWPAGLTPRKVLRSGAYVSHDDGVYTRKTPYASRLEGRLEAAIEVWGQVTSPGDLGRVVVGMGKRDAPYDEGMPVALRVRRAGSTVIEPLRSSVVVEKMDDHHAYLRGDEGLLPGDLVCFGISHPCTAFDKWQLVPLLDDEHVVVGLVRTFF